MAIATKTKEPFFERHRPKVSTMEPVFTDLADISSAPGERKCEFDPMDLSYLPYGVWVFANGTQILFTRSYKAIWARKFDHLGEMVDCAISPKLVHHTSFMPDDITRVGELHFRSDGHMNPRSDPRWVERCRKIVADFITGKDVMKYVINP